VAGAVEAGIVATMNHAHRDVVESLHRMQVVYRVGMVEVLARRPVIVNIT
jgi:hypothetical protein